MPEFITNKFNWLKSCKSNKDCPSPIVIRIWWTLTDFFSHRAKKFTCSWENSSKGNALTPLLSDNLLTFQTVRIFSVSINLPYKTVSTLFSLGHVINFPSKLPMSLFFAVAIVGLQSVKSNPFPRKWWVILGKRDQIESSGIFEETGSLDYDITETFKRWPNV